MNKLTEEFLKQVLEQYLTSRDFNGLALTLEHLKTIRKEIRELVSDEKISLYWDPENPHIKRFPDKSVKEQLDWLDSQDVGDIEKNSTVVKYGKFEFVMSELQCCVYPAPKYLKETQAKNKFSNNPFSRMLLFGEPQMKPIFFKPKVLYEYRDDPAYELRRYGVSGSIYYAGEDDKVFIKTFGTGLSKDLSKYEVTIVVYLSYLKDLDSFNQKRWQRYLLPNQDDYKIHRDYAIPTLLGEWDFNQSAYVAFIEEVKTINAMSHASFGKSIFKKEFEVEDLPLFSYILIPSEKEYNDFAKTLNNIFIDNIDPKFFEKQGIELMKGEIKKGTIQLLEEWLKRDFKVTDFDPIRNMLSIMRKDVRETRSRSSHEEIKNITNNNYFDKQRILINRAYEAVRMLRLILANHPKASSVEVSSWLLEGKISAY
jgi:hypothetical protein